DALMANQENVAPMQMQAASPVVRRVLGTPLRQAIQSRQAVAKPKPITMPTPLKKQIKQGKPLKAVDKQQAVNEDVMMSVSEEETNVPATPSSPVTTEKEAARTGGIVTPTPAKPKSRKRALPTPLRSAIEFDNKTLKKVVKSPAKQAASEEKMEEAE